MSPEAPFPHTHNPLVTADRIDGTPVFSPMGERIGHIKDLSIEKVSGKVIYAMLSFGGFLGIGERFHPLPWNVLKYDTAKDGYIVPLSKSELEKAPSYTSDELAAFGSDDLPYRRDLFAYYSGFGAAPYW